VQVPDVVPEGRFVVPTFVRKVLAGRISGGDMKWLELGEFADLRYG
jgi:hypothetical protein